MAYLLAPFILTGLFLGFGLDLFAQKGTRFPFLAIVIFFIVGAITLLQFRYTQMWEEVSENV